MKSLFVLVHENNEDAVYRTHATEELLAKLDSAGGEMSEYTGYEDSKDLALPLANTTPLSAFVAIAGSVPLEKIEVDEFLRIMGADGLDCFY